MENDEQKSASNQPQYRFLPSEETWLTGVVRNARSLVVGSYHTTHTVVDEAVERAHDISRTAEAHFDHAFHAAASVRQVIPGPGLSMATAGFIVGLPSLRFGGGFAAARNGILAACAAGLLLYPDYVAQHIIEWRQPRSTTSRNTSH
eukprot:TRINITY_DN18628_c0_g1::TRINITY_DN18628_c0_g1_i1::g.1126::m.1126 TRINITY_DN18628_c0_g1::TRINITY_DN18628_c0_g1_i1::g.1126  ORF type:complete len:162 (+),score=21.11 TRINITY_DN18628_c0_g1_i1:46-486(+)